MSTPRYSIFDKNGYWLTDIRTMGKRSWTLPSRGVVGECEFSLSIYEPKNIQKFMGFGRYLLVREANLPDWLGILYTPRVWPYGATTFRAYQAEKILDWRVTPILKITGTAGNLFRQILQYTNAANFNEKPIFPNSIYEADQNRDETLGDAALPHVFDIAQRSRNDFSVSYSFDANGRLYLLGNWYKQDGIDTGHYLRESDNTELSQNLLEENSDLFNDYVGVNDASTGSTRLVSHQWDDPAIAENGLYQKTMVFSGVKQQSTLDQNVLAQLALTSKASRTFDLTALNVRDTYSFLGVGNLWSVDLNKAGYEGSGLGTHAQVKIIGMEKEDISDKVRLMTEVMA